MILNFFAYFGNVLLLLNFILFVSKFKQLNKAHKILAFYLAVILCLQVVAIVLFNLNKDSVFCSHIQFVFQFVLLSFFYLTILKNRIQKNTVKILFITILISLIIQYFFIKQFNTFNLLEILLTYIPLILYSIFHFYNMLDSDEEFNYINMGILVYLLGNISIFLSGNIIVKITTDLSIKIFMLNMSIYIIYQLFILLEWKKSLSKINSNYEEDIF